MKFVTFSGIATRRRNANESSFFSFPFRVHDPIGRQATEFRRRREVAKRFKVEGATLASKYSILVFSIHPYPSPFYPPPLPLRYHSVTTPLPIRYHYTCPRIPYRRRSPSLKLLLRRGIPPANAIPTSLLRNRPSSLAFSACGGHCALSIPVFNYDLSRPVLDLNCTW